MFQYSVKLKAPSPFHLFLAASSSSHPKKLSGVPVCEVVAILPSAAAVAVPPSWAPSSCRPAAVGASCPDASCQISRHAPPVVQLSFYRTTPTIQPSSRRLPHAPPSWCPHTAATVQPSFRQICSRRDSR
ncbi:hypothetical protein GUJ93_ZPchr0012g21253 [Zizania palustris]|uniref:Uncharacterized protein n=1 Tax=Zizania palustris TaxID=103762 RepID=A0A8J5WNQ7_ZIZPA|nr:hypothetical protein GUJ93_ZPchr0012g21253 [Zizania palustris]